MSINHQISIRIETETNVWLEQRTGAGGNKAGFVRQLIEREMVREKEQELLAMFNEAATELTDTDREERESLLGGFAASEQLFPVPKKS